MTAPTNVTFTTGTTITSEWLNGVNDYVNELDPADHSAANVTYDPPFTNAVATNVEAKLAEYVSVKDFGAVGDGVTDDTTAIQNAIDSLGSVGGVVNFPSGTYKISSTLDIKDKYAVTLLGTGAPVASSHVNGSTLLYTGTGSSIFIDMRSSHACALENLQITFNNSGFTGYLVDLSHSTISSNDSGPTTISKCQFASNTGLLTNGTALNLNEAILVYIDACYFSGLGTAIDGQKSDGTSYSNNINITNCHFDNTYEVPIRYCGESWTLINNTFEPRVGGIAGAVLVTTTTPVKAFNFIGNWCGDVTSGTSTWVTLSGYAINITGNRFGGSAGAAAIDLYGVNGCTVKNNSFNLFGTAIVFDAPTSSNFSEQDNHFNTVTSVFSGLGNVNSFGQASQCYTELPNQFYIQSGYEQVTSGTPAAVTFPKAFNSLSSVVCSMHSPASASNTAYTTSVSSTGVTLNATGSGVNGVYWIAFGY